MTPDDTSDPKTPAECMARLLADLQDVTFRLWTLRNTNVGGRPLSVALTEVETGALWLQEAHRMQVIRDAQPPPPTDGM